VQLSKASIADAPVSVKPPELLVFALVFPMCSKRHLLIISNWELFVCVHTENLPVGKWYKYSLENKDKIVRQELQVYFAQTFLPVPSIILPFPFIDLNILIISGPQLDLSGISIQGQR
jgi:hypothetical protein